MDETDSAVSSATANRTGSAKNLTQEAADLIEHLARVIEALQDLLGLNPGGPVPQQHVPLTYASSELRQAEARAELTSKLTERERQVLALLVNGLSNRRIARTLSISEPTVKNHLHSVYLKLDVTDRTQAISRILRRAQ